MMLNPVITDLGPNIKFLFGGVLGFLDMGDVAPSPSQRQRSVLRRDGIPGGKTTGMQQTTPDTNKRRWGE